MATKIVTIFYWKISSWHPNIAVVFHTTPYKFCNFQAIIKSLLYFLKASTFLMYLRLRSFKPDQKEHYSVKDTRENGKKNM